MSDSPLGRSVSEGGSRKAPPLLFAPFRLPASAVDSLFGEGQSIACGTLVLRWKPNGLDKCRIAVISPKKTFRLAVQRSRARRLMREAFRLERPGLKPGYDLVLLGRNRLIGRSCDAVRKDLMWLCGKAGIRAKKGSHA